MDKTNVMELLADLSAPTAVRSQGRESPRQHISFGIPPGLRGVLLGAEKLGFSVPAFVRECRANLVIAVREFLEQCLRQG